MRSYNPSDGPEFRRGSSLPALTHDLPRRDTSSSSVSLRSPSRAAPHGIQGASEFLIKKIGANRPSARRLLSTPPTSLRFNRFPLCFRALVPFPKTRPALPETSRRRRCRPFPAQIPDARLRRSSSRHRHPTRHHLDDLFTLTAVVRRADEALIVQFAFAFALWAFHSGTVLCVRLLRDAVDPVLSFTSRLSAHARKSLLRRGLARAA